MDQIQNLKKKITIITIVSIIILGATFYFAIFPQIKDIQQVKSKIENQRIELEKRYIQGQNLRKTTDDLNLVQGEIEKMDEIYIKETEALDFVTSLEQIAEELYLEPKMDIQPISDDPKKDFYEKPLFISITGEYRNILEYISRLESSRYYINIDNVELNRIPKRIGIEEGSMMDASISAKVFWKK